MRRQYRPLALSLLLIASTSRAAVIAPLDVPDLVRLADRVVVAQVGASTSRWDDDGRHIVTDTTLEVREVLKGAPVQQLQVRVEGGVVGELAQQVAGAARLSSGSQVLLFLQDDDAKPMATPRCRVVGLARGLFTLRAGADGTELATQDLSGLEVQDPASGLLRPITAEVLDAELLRARIRALAAPPPATAR